MGCYLTQKEIEAVRTSAQWRRDLASSAWRPSAADLRSRAAPEESGAHLKSLLNIVNQHSAAMIQITELIAKQSAKLDAQNYALGAIGETVLSHTGLSGRQLFDIIVKSPNFEPVNEGVEPLLRRLFGVQPKLTVITSPTDGDK